LREDVFPIPENETTKPVPLQLVHPFEISFSSSTDVTAVRTIVQEFLGAPNLIERIPASRELLDQLKFSACLPPALAKRAVYGRRDLHALSQAFSLAVDSVGEL